MEPVILTRKNGVEIAAGSQLLEIALDTAAWKLSYRPHVKINDLLM
jgi:hypothetical protein